ncbi:MAG TPA: hypothetical protein VFR34_05370, partial [Paracoccaceae bacterium]|nr:hypothetical protein [Paracoccaceae bacterium]
MFDRILAALAAGAILQFVAMSPGAAAPPELNLKVAGRPELVLPAEEMTCVVERGRGEGLDVTDMPVTAFRRREGGVMVLAGNSNGYFLDGPSVESARRRDCDQILRSERNPDPSQFRDKEWVVALYAPGGSEVYGFVHNEFHGEEHGETNCRLRPSPERECWYASITWVKSTDGGKSFRRPQAPRNLVLAVPFRYRPGMLRAGVALPKIVRQGEWLYMLGSYLDRSLRGAGGQCLLRAPASRPERWEVWTGSGFAPVPGSPYLSPERPGAEPCAPVIAANVLSVKYVPRARLFLALTMSRDDVSYATSPDLIHWSDERQLFRREEALVDFSLNEYGNEEALPKYFSMLDPAS